MKFADRVAYVTAKTVEAALKLSPKDKKVIDCFLDKKECDGAKLTTDGTKLDGKWMGGNGIAVWEKGKIQMEDLGSKAAETVQRAVKKKAPKNWIGASANDTEEPAHNVTVKPIDFEVEATTEAKGADKKNAFKVLDGLVEDINNKDVKGLNWMAGAFTAELADQLNVQVGEAAKLVKEWMKGKTASVDVTEVTAVKTPSEQDGKASYDDDFKAGFKAGQEAYKKSKSVDISTGKKAYKRVSKKFGSWWVNGYGAAIDMERGAHATQGAQIAKKLKLKAVTEGGAGGGKISPEKTMTLQF